MRNYILIAATIMGLAAFTPNDSPAVNNHVAAETASCGITSNTLADEKALFTAETAYNIPADAYVRFDAAGQLPASVKATVRPLLIKAYDALKLARAAYNAGDGCSLKRYSDLAEALGNQAKAALPK
jgi:hypothetical protein